MVIVSLSCLAVLPVTSVHAMSGYSPVRTMSEGLSNLPAYHMKDVLFPRQFPWKWSLLPLG